MGRDAKEIICPFYKDETERSIRCEGIISNTCTNTFNGCGQKKMYQEEYCKRYNFSECSLAKNVIDQYATEDVREKEEKYTELYKTAQKKGV